MNINDTMHPAQVAILHALLFRPHAGFAELQKASALSSDHFNFHLKKMLEQDVVRKNAQNKYELTMTGKEFANRFDTDARVVERQPKVAVLLLIEREDGKFICQQRLKQPFYGFWGRPTGKIRFGETILEAAARELMEETGLIATLNMRGIYHKLDYNAKTSELLEDKIFFVVHGTHPQGELLEEFDGGRNAWFSVQEAAALDNAFEGLAVHPINSDDTVPLAYIEQRYDYKPEQY